MSREFWVGLVAGLIIGWLIEWLIDWTYWRKRFAQVKGARVDKKDELTKIKGIGPIIEDRLNKAGVFTFKQVSKLSHEEIERYIGNADNLSDEQAFIKQAKKLAKKKKKR